MQRTGKSVLPLVAALVLALYGLGFRLPAIDWPVIPIITPVESPIPVDGLHVMVIEETGERQNLPASQVAIMTSVKLRKWLDEHNAEWRIIDASGNDIENDDEKWQTAFKRPRPSLPWLIVSNHPHGGKEIPLPETVDLVIRELESTNGL